MPGCKHTLCFHFLQKDSYLWPPPHTRPINTENRAGAHNFICCNQACQLLRQWARTDTTTGLDKFVPRCNLWHSPSPTRQLLITTLHPTLNTSPPPLKTKSQRPLFFHSSLARSVLHQFLQWEQDHPSTGLSQKMHFCGFLTEIQTLDCPPPPHTHTPHPHIQH